MLSDLLLEALVGPELLELLLNQCLHRQILVRTGLYLLINALVLLDLASLYAAFLCLKACHLVYQVEDAGDGALLDFGAFRRRSHVGYHHLSDLLDDFAHFLTFQLVLAALRVHLDQFPDLVKDLVLDILEIGLVSLLREVLSLLALDNMLEGLESILVKNAIVSLLALHVAKLALQFSQLVLKLAGRDEILVLANLLPNLLNLLVEACLRPL